MVKKIHHTTEVLLPFENNNRKCLMDITFVKNGEPKPIIFFIHGFKGFKDWGYWHLMAQQFAEAGYVFLKMNLSHNGTTPEQPSNFADLEAFGRNTISKELFDVKSAMEWLHGQHDFDEEIDLKKIGLIGHSRGGGTALLYAAQDERIKAVATWASISSFKGRWSQDQLDFWKKEGVLYIENSRTKQQMPLYYDIVTDFLENEEDYSIDNALEELDIPLLIVHGTADPTVEIREAHELRDWKPDSVLHIVTDGDHVFGGSHPYNKNELPPHAQEVYDVTSTFFNVLK